MECPRCHTQNPPQAKFCLECASPLARTCSNCGTPLPPTAKFCLECAHPVSAPRQASDQPRFASPDAYTPKHLAEKILTSKGALEGERKQVTVLFADVKGSMELLADRDPEEARKLLDPVLERMIAHRQKERGNEAWVLRLLGEIAAHADPPDVKSAEEHYHQALARANELGMRPLAAHCHLGFGKLYRRTSDAAKAPEHLTTAAAMYREMGMTYWLERAEAELGPSPKP